MLRITMFALLWILIAPSQLGGSTIYLMISGNSMEPGFFRGDLAVARKGNNYSVGDIVVYEHPRIGPVFHRIVGKDAGSYEMQGDNNYWVDSYRPNEEEILGRFKFKIPFLGQIISSLRSPENLALFSVGASALLVASVATGPREKSRKEKNRRKKETSTNKVTSMNFPIRLQDVFLFLLLLTFGAIFFGIIAFSRPTEIELPSSSPFQHTGHFSYTAAVPESIYGSETLKSGQPIFRRITDQFDIIFDYVLVSDEITDVSGTYKVDAVISSNNGWRRVVNISDLEAFSGSQISIDSRFDINYLQSFVDTFATETGILPNQYMVEVIPHIELFGTFHGDVWADAFSPTMRFRVSELQVELITDGNELDEILFQSRDGTLFDVVSIENSLDLFGIEVNIHTARLSDIAFVALFAGATVVVGLRILFLGRQPEAQRIKGLYNRLLIPVSGVQPEEGKKVIEVDAIESLIRIAQQEGVSVLKEEGERNLHFFVQATTGTFHTQVRK